MGRPPLPVGTWGTVFVTALPRGGYRARTRFRDYDGVTRLVERTGRTKNAARSALTTYLTERSAPAGDDITADTRLRVVAEVWHAEVRARDLAAGTVRRYREVLDDHVLPGVGGLLVREATVSRLDAFLKGVTTRVGAPTAKLCRTVLSGTLGLAVRHGAAAANPVRDVADITVTRPESRALTLEEVATLRAAALAWQEGRPIKPTSGYVEPARGPRRADDLLDIVDVLLATGARIGELLAIRWTDVELDPDHAAVTITGTIINVKDDVGRWHLERQAHPKTSTSRRRLLLPRFATDTLLRRRVTQPAGNVHDLVFPSRNGALRDPNNVRKTWRKVRDQAGFGWVTPHTFRKTVATLIDANADLAAAAGQLGHAGTSVTARHYVQKTHSGPDVRSVLEAIVPRDESL
ncbi:site-specific integrase [Cellulosimicrobium cellulans]|uniref:site-specific integrase n=1 Tax=Cellulosimicrobium cellulans TaxID=1710 RepID=UPI000DF818B1|nr:tyrosine-type recombinase/integrase [Cellulosimicrobium cellulans]QUC01184.1 tyrosine-type recombinase/integrase [Cellulosimicrobium cellulans]